MAQADGDPENRGQQDGLHDDGPEQGTAAGLGELQERFQELKDKKTRAEADRDHAEQRLAELKEQARATYGTDDVDELKEKLAQMKAENERKRREYQQHLDRIEAELSAVEKRVDEDGGSR